MSKLRKVQFFRNNTIGQEQTYATHALAIAGAEGVWTSSFLADLADGEIVLYRYLIENENPAKVHTIVGVVRNDGTNKYVEILANYDAVGGSIGSLNVTGYEQAYVTSTASGSSFTVQGIQENAGLIGVDATHKVTINIDGQYDDTTNKIATQSTVTNAIEALDSVADADDTTAQSGHATITTTTPSADFKVLNSVTEADGKLTAADAYQLKKVAATGAAADVSIADSGNLFTATDVEAALAEVQGNVQTVAASIKDGKIKYNSTDVFSANTDTNLTLRQYDFVYNNGELGVNVQTLTSATNKIATMEDIASLSGAMHYKGGVTAYPTPTADTKAGDTYIVTQRFEYPANSGNWYEVGDMLVATADGTSATYTVVQSNLTLGMGTGEVAVNQTALTATQIVVAGTTGVQTTGYTIGGAVSTQSITALPTDKQVYDAIQDLAVNSVSETVGVTNNSGSDSATVTDTLTVDGTAQAGQAFTIAGGDGVNVTGDASTQTITVAADVAAHSHQKNTTTVNADHDDYNLLKVDANGELSVSDTWDCGVYI